MPLQAHLVRPVTVDLRDQVPAVCGGECPVRAAEGEWGVVPAAGGGPDDPPGVVRRGLDQQDPAVLDVRGEQGPPRQQHRVIGIGGMIRGAAGYPGSPVPVNDCVCGDVDHADDGVVLLGGDDVPAVRGEEGVVRKLEGLPPGEIPRFGELPPDASLRVHDEQPVVPVVRDQDVPGQHGRIRAGRQVAPAPGWGQPGQRGRDRAAAPGLGGCAARPA